MIKIVTVEREYGCGGGGIAAKLANRLGWALWDREITQQIAQRLKCDVASVEQREERLDPTFYRLMKTFMRGSYEESFQGCGADMLDAEHLARLFETVVTDIAKRGNCVIVGRGSTWFLRNHPEAFHTFIFAPREDKILRLTKMGKSRAEAEHLVQTVDTERAAFVKKYHQNTWPQRDLYHLMLNSKMGDNNVIETILSSLTLLNHETPAAVKA